MFSIREESSTNEKWVFGSVCASIYLNVCLSHANVCIVCNVTLLATQQWLLNLFKPLHSQCVDWVHMLFITTQTSYTSNFCSFNILQLATQQLHSPISVCLLCLSCNVLKNTILSLALEHVKKHLCSFFCSLNYTKRQVLVWHRLRGNPNKNDFYIFLKKTHTDRHKNTFSLTTKDHHYQYWQIPKHVRKEW